MTRQNVAYNLSNTALSQSLLILALHWNHLDKLKYFVCYDSQLQTVETDLVDSSIEKLLRGLWIVYNSLECLGPSLEDEESGKMGIRQSCSRKPCHRTLRTRLLLSLQCWMTQHCSPHCRTRLPKVFIFFHGNYLKTLRQRF